MQYSVRHVTRFQYLGPVRESVIEVRLQPRSDVRQTCFSFYLDVVPETLVHYYTDHQGNTVHYFDIAEQHEELRLESRTVVDVADPVLITNEAESCTWNTVDEAVAGGEFWDFLNPSRFIVESDSLRALAEEFEVGRRLTPVALLRELSSRIYEGFAYQPLTTHANSPIDDALQNRAGVCQDFAHIYIALARRLGIPCRYVSGYLYHRTEDGDRSAEDASHAWAEAYVPGAGWLGFDPTNNILAGDRHIVVAVGRDYADVPPTKGVFKGVGGGDLRVGVQVLPAGDDNSLPAEIKLATMPQVFTAEELAALDAFERAQDQQQ